MALYKGETLLAGSGAGFMPENEGETEQILTKTETGYAWCDAPGKIKYGYIDLLVVGGGGNGGGGDSNGGPGGGGAGGFIESFCYAISSNHVDGIDVLVGGGGSNGEKIGNGGNSCFGTVIAYGGGKGGNAYSGSGVAGGSGGGAGATNNSSSRPGNPGLGCGAQGNNGGIVCYASGSSTYIQGGSGGGGAGGVGGAGSPSRYCGGTGGAGKWSAISGTNQLYSNGGPGGGNHPGTYYCNCMTIGAGGRGIDNVCSGCGGVVIIRYHTDGSDGICPTSIGGTKYTCGDYTIHCWCRSEIGYKFYPVFK